MKNRLFEYVAGLCHQSLHAFERGELMRTLILALVAFGVAYLTALGVNLKAPHVGELWEWTIGFWVIFLFIFIAPFRLWLEERKKVEILEECRKPRINVFLDPRTKGITEIPTELKVPLGVPPQKGPSSKWIQFTVSCSTEMPLHKCKARLLSVERLNGGPQEELVEEHVACGWSQLNDLEITISPSLPQRANLFSIYENHQGALAHVEPLKLRLRDGMQLPGRYRIKVAVAAQDAPTKQASFLFEWSDFSHASLTQEP